MPIWIRFSPWQKTGSELENPPLENQSENQVGRFSFQGLFDFRYNLAGTRAHNAILSFFAFRPHHKADLVIFEGSEIGVT